MGDFSKDKLLEFLDYLKNKGMMNSATVAARKAAVNTFLSILSEDEIEDLRKVDFDDVAIRFSHLKGSDFKPESIKVYKSRVSSALEDLKNYKANPLSFKPSAMAAKPTAGAKSDKDSSKAVPARAPNDFDGSANVTFPVPIRPDVVVKIAGLPSDLSKKEATKIANVILALATDDET